MTKGQLVNYLAQIPDEAEVFIAKPITYERNGEPTIKTHERMPLSDIFWHYGGAVDLIGEPRSHMH